MSLSNTNTAVHITDEPLTTKISTAATPLLQDAVDTRITKVRPMATPIDQISRCGDIRHADSMRVNYYEVDVKPVITQLAASQPREPFTALPDNKISITVNLENNAMFAASDTLLMPDIQLSGNPLMFYVTEADEQKTVITPIASEATQAFLEPLLKPGCKVVRMGRAAMELDVQTAQFETLPKRNFNYCQIFKMQIEESVLHRLANKEASWNLSDQEEVAVMDMRQGMEKNFLFGHRAQFAGASGSEDVYLTGGIWNQNLATFNYDPAQLCEKTLVALSRQAFTGTGGAARKILIAGSDLVESLSNLPHQRILDGGRTYTRWGLEFNEIKTNFGTLYLIHSEIFDQCGHASDGMVIDPQMLTKYVHIPFTTERLDLRKSGQRNTDAVVITEASCLVLRNPQSHMRIVAKAGSGVGQKVDAPNVTLK